MSLVRLEANNKIEFVKKLQPRQMLIGQRSSLRLKRNHGSADAAATPPLDREANTPQVATCSLTAFLITRAW